MNFVEAQKDLIQKEYTKLREERESYWDGATDTITPNEMNGIQMRTQLVDVLWVTILQYEKFGRREPLAIPPHSFESEGRDADAPDGTCAVCGWNWRSGNHS